MRKKTSKSLFWGQVVFAVAICGGAGFFAYNMFVLPPEQWTEEWTVFDNTKVKIQIERNVVENFTPSETSGPAADIQERKALQSCFTNNTPVIDDVKEALWDGLFVVVNQVEPSSYTIDYVKIYLLNDDSNVYYLLEIFGYFNNTEIKEGKYDFAAAGATMLDSLAYKLRIEEINNKWTAQGELRLQSSAEYFEILKYNPNIPEIPDTSVTISDVSVVSNITQAIISFSTNEPTEAVVEFDTDGLPYGNRITDSQCITNHNIVITGLMQETEYYYRITVFNEQSTAGSILDSSSFRTITNMQGSDQLSVDTVANHVVLNEVMFDGVSDQTITYLELTSERDEYFVLYNPTGSSVDLGGWTIGNGNGKIQFNSSITLKAASSITVAKDAANFYNRFGMNCDYEWNSTWGTDKTNDAVPDLMWVSGEINLANSYGYLFLNSSSSTSIDIIAWGNSPSYSGLPEGSFMGTTISVSTEGLAYRRIVTADEGTEITENTEALASSFGVVTGDTLGPLISEFNNQSLLLIMVSILVLLPKKRLKFM